MNSIHLNISGEEQDVKRMAEILKNAPKSIFEDVRRMTDDLLERLKVGRRAAGSRESKHQRVAREARTFKIAIEYYIIRVGLIPNNVEFDTLPDDPNFDKNLDALCASTIDRCFYDKKMVCYTNNPLIVKRMSAMINRETDRENDTDFLFVRQDSTMIATADADMISSMLHVFMFLPEMKMYFFPTSCCDKKVSMSQYGTTCKDCGKHVCWEHLSRGLKCCPECGGDFVEGLMERRRRDYACRKCNKISPTTCKCCGQCRKAVYCSRECQVADWPAHQPTCPRPSPPAPAPAS